MEALLIIDVQEAYVSHLRNEKVFLDTIDYINHTSSMFRAAGKAVIVIRHVAQGSTGEYNNVIELKVGANDKEILKKFNSSFWETELEETLNNLGIKFLVLSGYAAEYCISATFFGAKERGFVPTLLENGILSKTPEGLLASKLSRPHSSIETLDYLLKK